MVLRQVTIPKLMGMIVGSHTPILSPPDGCKEFINCNVGLSMC